MFDGNQAKFRGWVFDLLVAVGQINKDLSKELKSIMQKEEDWNPDEHLENKDLHNKFKSELFGVLCSLTTGEAKTVVKGMGDAMAVYHQQHSSL